jgi:hypothetical protein
MDTWGVVFLGVIALGSLVQIVFLVALLVFGRQLARRIDALQSRVDREIAPSLENLNRVTRVAAEIADIANVQARRLDLVLSDTVQKVEETTALVQRLVVRPLRPLGGIAAFLRGVQRGVEVYHKLGSVDRAAPRPARRREEEDEEHLFV